MRNVYVNFYCCVGYFALMFCLSDETNEDWLKDDSELFRS